jgi:hypothetical protein
MCEYSAFLRMRLSSGLEVIKQEIEGKLIASMEANRPELPLLH